MLLIVWFLHAFCLWREPTLPVVIPSPPPREGHNGIQTNLIWRPAAENDQQQEFAMRWQPLYFWVEVLQVKIACLMTCESKTRHDVSWNPLKAWWGRCDNNAWTLFSWGHVSRMACLVAWLATTSPPPQTNLIWRPAAENDQQQEFAMRWQPLYFWVEVLQVKIACLMTCESKTRHDVSWNPLKAWRGRCDNNYYYYYELLLLSFLPV